MTTRTQQALLSVATWLLVVSATSAQAQVWGEIELPGGVTAARQVIGLGTETRTPSAFLVDFIRTFHQFGDVDSLAIDNFERYLRYVQELRGVLAVWPDGMQLGAERLRGQARDRWRGTADVLALRLREVKNRPVLEVDRDDDAKVRVGWLAALGIDVARLAQRLNAGERVRLAIPADLLPLPLPAIWPALLERQGKPDIVRLGATHRPALLYVGLMSLDSETLAFFAANPKLLDLDTQEAGVLAAFGRSIHVRGGRLDVPGGAAYAPIWVQLVDRRLDEPVDFIRRLLSRDEGRLAFLYDTVAHVPPVTQTALFGAATGTEGRVDALDDHYKWFREVDPAWKVGTRPFFRPPFDPSLALRLLDIGPNGSVGPAWWPDLLEKIAGSDDWPDKPIKDIEDRRADLAWAFRWMFDAKDAEARFRLLRYAQRRFAAAPEAGAPSVEVALRGFARMPALMLALERMRVENTAVLAAMANAAVRLTTSGDLERVGPDLREWQAALSILEQICRRRAVAPAARDTLLQSLAAVVPAEGPPPSGAVAIWVIDQLNPALGVPAAGSGDYETGAIAAWLAPQSQPVRMLSWEGLDYRIDRVGPVVRDATAVRSGAKGPTLSHLELLVRTRREMAAGAKTLAMSKDFATRLESIRTALLTLRDAKNKPLLDTGDLEDAARTMARIRRDKDLNRVPRQVPKLDRTFDDITTRVLPDLAYALAAAPTPQPQIYADAAQRHVITASVDLAPDLWRQSAWRLPKTGTLPTGEAGVLGALLALDTTLADGQLRRLAVADATAPPVEGKFNPLDRDALTQRLVHATPAEELDAAAAAALDAMRDGQTRWTALTAGASSARGETERALAPILGETRANLALWLLERAQVEAATEMVQPSERLRLAGAPAAALSPALGLSSHVFDGCLCLRPPVQTPVTEWLGRGDSGHVSVLLADLELRLAEALTELKVPLFLLELILPMALQDTIDRVGQFSPEDWEAVAVARFIPTSRVEEYLLALVAEGVLAPPATPGQPARRH